MTAIPPSRWKVVERGRRLEVIDTQAGADAGPSAKGLPPSAGSARIGLTANAAASPAALADRSWSMERGASGARSLGIPRKLRFDGTLGWTTHPFYDANGPRAVVLDGGSARWIGGVLAIGAAALVAVLMALLAFSGTNVLPLLIVIVVAATSGWKHVKPLLTRRLDGIAV